MRSDRKSLFLRFFTAQPPTHFLINSCCFRPPLLAFHSLLSTFSLLFPTHQREDFLRSLNSHSLRLHDFNTFFRFHQDFNTPGISKPSAFVGVHFHAFPIFLSFFVWTFPPRSQFSLLRGRLGRRRRFCDVRQGMALQTCASGDACFRKQWGRVSLLEVLSFR
ncbi:hypothetical protein DFJ77DRAFT_98143 [Powellomyces hirtus]|nr:hypothetical protein DFJ77DRAFT_98143 [Powellomyces hirtus]